MDAYSSPLALPPSPPPAGYPSLALSVPGTATTTATAAPAVGAPVSSDLSAASVPVPAGITVDTTTPIGTKSGGVAPSKSGGGHGSVGAGAVAGSLASSHSRSASPVDVGPSGPTAVSLAAASAQQPAAPKQPPSSHLSPPPQADNDSPLQPPSVLLPCATLPSGSGSGPSVPLAKPTAIHATPAPPNPPDPPDPLEPSELPTPQPSSSSTPVASTSISKSVGLDHHAVPSEEALEMERERTRERRPKRILNGYVLGKTLGAGSMGKVKLANVAATNQKVAIKMVPRHTSVAAAYEQARKQNPLPNAEPARPAAHILTKARDKDAAKELRALREGSLQLLLYHPYVCGLRELIVQPHYYYLVEEYVSGGQLLDYIIAHGRLRERVARRFARQLVSALTYLHANNVVHRDLKIENVLLSEAGNVKLVDFGLANLWSPHRALRTFCGSLYFAAPELLSARPYVGPEVDVWSLGVVLFVLVTGRVPFDDPSVSALHRKIQRGLLQFPAHLTSDCRHALSRILTVDPHQRATLLELANHPFFTKGQDGPVETYIPQRMPLRAEELDKSVMAEMQGFAFGSPQEIERKLIEILTSDAYLAALASWDNRHGHAMGPDSLVVPPRAPPRPPPLLPNPPQTDPSAPTTELPPPDPSTLDPIAGFHPMLSIYYLTREKMDRQAQSDGVPAFAEATLRAPSVPSALASNSTPSLSCPSGVGSSMPTAADIPMSPSMSGFGSNALPSVPAEPPPATPSPAPSIPASHAPPPAFNVPQRPAETMRWSRGLDVGMVSGLGDVGISVSANPLRAARNDETPTSPLLPLPSHQSSSDTLTTTSHGHGRMSSSSACTHGSDSVRPYSPASMTHVPVFDRDLRDRSRPQGEMRGPPRSRDAGASLEHTLAGSRSPLGVAGSRSSLSSTISRPPTQMSRTSSTAIATSGLVHTSPARDAPPPARHVRTLTFGGWRTPSRSIVPWKAADDRDDHAPTSDISDAPLTPPRRAASMHTHPPLATPATEEDSWNEPDGPPASLPENTALASLKKLGSFMSRSLSGTPFGGDSKAASLLGADSHPDPEAQLSSNKEGVEGKAVHAQAEAVAHLGPPKPVFLKGLFSVQTTSTRAPAQVQSLLAGALIRIGVKYKLVPGGFECVHMPSLVPSAPNSSPVPDTSATAHHSEDEAVDGPKNVSDDFKGNDAGPEGALTAVPDDSLNGMLDAGWQATEDVAHPDTEQAASPDEHPKHDKQPIAGRSLSFRTPWSAPRALQFGPSHRNGSSTTGSTASASSAGSLGGSTFAPGLSSLAMTESPTTHDRPHTEEPSLAAGAGSGVTVSRLEEMAVRFELSVVKVPLIGVCGVQFHRVQGNPWQYQLLAKRILEEAKI